MILVIYATRAVFKPKIKKKIKKSTLKKIAILQAIELSCSKKLNETFLNFLFSIKVIEIFYTQNKTLLGKTTHSSNLYYLLAPQASRFLIHFAHILSFCRKS